MVGKQKSGTRALRIHNWQLLRATLGHCYITAVSLNSWLGERTKFNFLQ